MTMSETSLSGLMPPDASQYRLHMAWVPVGIVIAKVSGSPDALALSAIGFRSLAVLTPACFSLLLSVMAWPFRFSNQGMIIGFTGDPASPMVEASGMPMSMWVA